MEIKIDSLIPFDTLRTDLEHVFSVVEKNGKVVLLKDNKPVYIILKYETQAIEANTIPDKQINYENCKCKLDTRTVKISSS